MHVPLPHRKGFIRAIAPARKVRVVASVEAILLSSKPIASNEPKTPSKPFAPIALSEELRQPTQLQTRKFRSGKES